jgi:simple sugar transport system substrate-binding protein
MIMKKFLIVTLVVGLVLLQASAIWAADKMKFYVVSHGGPADPFWGVVMKGAEDAGKEFVVDVTYLGPEKFSIQKLVDMVETAVADNPDGLVVTVTDAKALDEPLKDAINNKGIPVVAINVPDYRGFEEKIPYLAYVGADDYMVGIEGARRMLKEFAPEKPKRGVVSVHEVGHAGLEARARGITEVFTEAGIPVEKLATSPNASETYQAIDAYLTKNPDTDAVFCLGPLDTHPTLKLLEEKDLVGKVKLGAVDLSDIMIKAIKEDKLVFTVEQQQYLQGYLPINLLILYNKYGLIPHDDILTGPAIVDKSNVEIVEEMVSKKYR